MALCSSASDCALPALVRPAGSGGGGASELQAPFFPPPNHYFALASSPLFFASGAHSTAQPTLASESVSGANAEYYCRASHAQANAISGSGAAAGTEHPYAQQYKQQQHFYGDAGEQARKLLAATGAQAQVAAAAMGGGSYHNVGGMMPDDVGLFAHDIHFRGLYPTRVRHCFVQKESRMIIEYYVSSVGYRTMRK